MNNTPIPDQPSCPQCSAPLPANAPGGLCPACLLKAGVGEDTITDGVKTVPFVPPSIGELAPLFPQLDLVELIGKGGMGAVYKARQKELDRVVALKILPPSISGAPGFAERFAREAKVLAKLNHPGIVTIHDFGRADGLYFFLMEFVDGVNLRQLLRGERLAPREALAIVPQICDALQFAHDHGLVHRDIKPENILMDRRGRVKVADFGLAKLVEAGAEPLGGEAAHDPSLTEAGKIMGTPSYMAPEQTEHPDEVDHRADIYALGVVFYEMLTGEPPQKILEAPSRKVKIDVRLDEVVLRALEKNPARRYAQASIFKTEVETIASTASQAGLEPFSSGMQPADSTLPLDRQIWAHMDAGEKREMMMRNVMFAIWNAATWFVPLLIIFTTHGQTRWLYATLTLGLGVAAIPIWRKILREGFSAAKWAQEKGITSAQLKASIKASKAPPWAIVGGGLVMTGALLIYEFVIVPHAHWSKSVSATMRPLVTFSLTALYCLFIGRLRKGSRKVPDMVSGATRRFFPAGLGFSKAVPATSRNLLPELLKMGASLLLVALLTTACVGITLYLQPHLRSDVVPSMIITFLVAGSVLFITGIVRGIKMLNAARGGTSAGLSPWVIVAQACLGLVLVVATLKVGDIVQTQNHREFDDRNWIVDDLERKMTSRDEIAAKIAGLRHAANASLLTHVHALAQLTAAALNEPKQRETARNEALALLADSGTLLELRLQEGSTLAVNDRVIRDDLRTFGERFLPRDAPTKNEAQLTALFEKTHALRFAADKDDGASGDRLNGDCNDLMELLAKWEDTPDQREQAQKLVRLFSDEEKNRAKITEQHRAADAAEQALHAFERSVIGKTTVSQ